jgi:DNA-binding CsgD family transcriptional regulator
MKEKLNLLIETLDSTPSVPVNWESVEMQLENLHPGFLIRLLAKHPNLSLKDKKLCTYIRLGLSSKEISGLQNITSKSVEIARVRLRKKMKISKDIRLLDYVSQL